MPLFDFKCKNNHYTEQYLSADESTNPDCWGFCKECNENLEKTLSAPNVTGANTGGRGKYEGNI